MRSGYGARLVAESFDRTGLVGESTPPCDRAHILVEGIEADRTGEQGAVESVVSAIDYIITFVCMCAALAGVAYVLA
jgi:hypothetical protein